MHCHPAIVPLRIQRSTLSRCVADLLPMHRSSIVDPSWLGIFATARRPAVASLEA
jgi:hypothetical protein